MPILIPSSCGNPAPAAAPAGPPALPANFDPCGGPQELLNKFGVTPCVVVAGEAMLSAGYVSAKVNGNVQVGTIATLPATALVRIYPQALATVGLTPRTDIEFTPSSYVRVDTAHFPLLVSGDTDFQVGFKQRVAFDPVHGTITSVAASVEFPTGSPALRAPGPAYKGELLGSYAFPRHLGLIYDLQLSNVATNNSQGRDTTLSWTNVGSRVPRSARSGCQTGSGGGAHGQGYLRARPGLLRRSTSLADEAKQEKDT